MAPSKDVSTSIVTFLKNQGAVQVEDFRDMIKLTASVKFIESLFQTELHVFSHNVSMLECVNSEVFLKYQHIM